MTTEERQDHEANEFALALIAAQMCKACAAYCIEPAVRPELTEIYWSSVIEELKKL